MNGIARIVVALAATSLLLVGCAPTGDPTPADTPSESASPTPESVTGPLTLFYVAIGDDGVSGEALGCGDSLVSIESEDVTTDDVLRASIERLLSDSARDLGESGLSTALSESTLSYASGSVDAGVVSVELSGELAPAGECDNPRIIAQLERTAIAATGATEARITVDGELLEDALSLQ